MNEKHATVGSHDLNAIGEKPLRNKTGGNDDRRNVDDSTKDKTAKSGSSANEKHAGSGTTVLAGVAFILALASAGGGYVLWQNLTQVQLSAAKNEGVSVGELDKSEAGLRSWVTTQNERNAAEFNATLTNTRNDLEKQIAATEANVKQNISTLENKLQETVSDVRQNVANLQNTITEQQGSAQTNLTETKASLQALIQQNQAAIQNEIASAKTEVAAISGAFKELRDQVTARVQTNEQTQSALQATVQQSQLEIKEAVGRNQLHWALNEVEYMLNVANRQVALEQNANRAITTLRTADQRLQTLGDPGLLKVREAVQNDIASLEKVGAPDIDGIALSLNRLANDVSKLPTADERSARESANVPAEAPALEHATGAAKGIAQAAWDGLRGLVVVRKNGEVSAPFIPPEQRYFLQENLRLQISAARLAALQQNAASYKTSIETATQWTKEHFDSKVDATQQFIAELSRLGAIAVAPQLPDVSQSLRVLRETRPGLSS